MTEQRKKQASADQSSSFSTVSLSDSDILRQSVRSVVLLVLACVLFVGTLSVVAIAVMPRLFGTPAPSAATETVKKPLSI